MRILLLTQWFDPEPTFKGLLFAKELQRLGHDVTVLTGFPNYPGGRVYEGYRVKPITKEVVEGIPVTRVALYPSHDGSGLRRALNYVSFAATSSLAALGIRRPDVAYVYHPPATVGSAALVLKRLRGVPFVYDVQDLWPQTLAATGMVGNKRVLGLVGAWMRSIYRSAAFVVTLSQGMRDAIVAEGTPPAKVHVIRNWADEAQLTPVRPSVERAKELGFEGRFSVVFAGTIGKAQGLETVLDAAELLRDVPDVEFVIVGGGIAASGLRVAAQERSLTNVRFLDRRPLSEIGEVLALADALLVHLKDDPLFAFTIPSKTQAYLLAGRPILMGVRGDAAGLVEEAGAGLSFEPENPAQLAAAVVDLKSKTVAEREAMGKAGAEYYAANLSLATGASAFERVLARAALTKPRYGAIKRIADVILAAGAGIVVALPVAVLALVVRLRLGSPVLFRQTRPGIHGQPFEMVKFRTMVDARDKDGRELPDRDRLTPFGAALRRSSLDELPTLWNILRGDMSVVGPRPLLMRYTQFFTEEERLRLLVRPGLTGWAQVNGRNTASWDERLAMDVWYVRHFGAALDVKIIAQTFGRVVKRSGAIADPESIMQNLDDERRDRGAAS